MHRKAPVTSIQMTGYGLVAPRRQASISRVSVRDIEPKDFNAYFRLRYDVWSQLCYIPEHVRVYADPCKFDINYTDLCSDAIGCFVDVANGQKLIACGRLVYEPQARPSTPHGELVKEFVDCFYPELKPLLQTPRGQALPFDVLESFPEFLAHYRDLVRNRVRKAEISRIITHPDHRHKGIGRCIVNRLVEKAREEGMQYLFLACRQEHSRFYAKCGFQQLQGIRCDRFVNVETRAISMEQWLI